MYKLSEIANRIISYNYKAFLYTSSFFDEGAKSYLLKETCEVITINSVEELNSKLNLIDQRIAKDKVVLSLLNYEAGYLFEERLNGFLSEKLPLMKFFVFAKDQIEEIDSNKILLNKFNQDFLIKDFNLNESKEDYVKKISEIKKYIKEGDTYQVNYTLKGKFNFEGKIESLFQNLIFNQSTQYSALINDEDKYIISISPELFFSIEGNRIISKPMKGTIARGFNITDDNEKRLTLKSSKKDKSENVMIVDLLRNDIGRISKTDSVKVTSIYDVEKYETIYQLTSKIIGELIDKKYSKVIPKLFPCGSITGAPKIRTMKIIHELENEKRGIYTGAIGIINKDKSVFNVAIRTVVINKHEFKGEIGLGSGIVWDSDTESEYDEVKLKSNFLLKPNKYFEIFETMLLENGKIFLLDEHLNRLEKTAYYFMFKFNREIIIEKLSNEISDFGIGEKKKIKLLLSKDGLIKMEISEEKPIKSRKIILSENRISSKNSFQYFKTTNRGLYNEEFTSCSKEGYFDIIYFNENKDLAEGAISNIFLFLGDLWITPKISCGILDGTYRNHFIKNHKVLEKNITKDDMLNAEKVVMTNSVKGEVDILEIYEKNQMIWSKIE